MNVGEREGESMDHKTFMDPEEFKKQFKRMREEGPMHQQKVQRFMHMRMENEVKLFTDKNKMVEYVNQLTGIENVEIFKIEDQLYKVLVSRRPVEKECCKDHNE